MALIPSRIDVVGGEAKTLPATPAVSMPDPMYPAQKGSCPEPPPNIFYKGLLHTILHLEIK